MIKLTPRLKKIFELILPDLLTADIGTDHGYIPISLIKEGKANKAFASDINKGPINQAIKNAKNNNVLDFIDFRIGPGLTVYKPGEIEQVIIAGMGGEEISLILKENLNLAQSLKHLILQPMTKPEILRSFLSSNGFEILNETVIKEKQSRDHFYSILSVIPGEMEELSEDELEFGKLSTININDEYFEFLKYKKNLLSERLEKMKNSNNEKTKKRREQFQRRLNYIDNINESIKNSGSN